MSEMTENMPKYSRILVGTDGSALAGPTVRRAVSIAASNEADVVIVCAYTAISDRDAASSPEIAATKYATMGQVPGVAAATDALERAVDVAEGTGVRVAAALLVDGEPAEALLEAAKQYRVDALVLGAIRDTSIVGRLLGNVASDVVRRAHRDVLIVRPPEEGAEEAPAEAVGKPAAEAAGED